MQHGVLARSRIRLMTKPTRRYRECHSSSPCRTQRPHLLVKRRSAPRYHVIASVRVAHGTSAVAGRRSDELCVTVGVSPMHQGAQQRERGRTRARPLGRWAHTAPTRADGPQAINRSAASSSPAWSAARVRTTACSLRGAWHPCRGIRSSLDLRSRLQACGLYVGHDSFEACSRRAEHSLSTTGRPTEVCLGNPSFSSQGSPITRSSTSMQWSVLLRSRLATRAA